MSLARLLQFNPAEIVQHNREVDEHDALIDAWIADGAPSVMDLARRALDASGPASPRGIATVSSDGTLTIKQAADRAGVDPTFFYRRVKGLEAAGVAHKLGTSQWRLDPAALAAAHNMPQDNATHVEPVRTRIPRRRTAPTTTSTGMEWPS